MVTGSEGFIGSHLVEALVRAGHEVKGFVFYNSFNSWGWLEDLPKDILSHVEVFTGDVRDPNGVKTALQGCSQVYHLAALIGIPFSYHSPQSYIETNIQGTLNVLQGARDLGLEKVIHTSTSEVYGTAQYVPIDEKHPLVGQSPYSASKIGADQLAYSYYASFGTPVVTVRPFNTFGPRQSARAVIPTVISQIVAKEKTIRLGNLDARRDFNYVADTVSGFIQAAKSSKENFGKVYNLATGTDYSIGETAQMIKKLMGSNIEIEFDSKRVRPDKSEVERLQGDATLARKEIGFSPKFADAKGFENGLKQTIDWFSRISDSNRYKASIYNI